MILATELEEKTHSAIQKNDIALIQEIFMTLPNKKKVMNPKEYQQHIKDLFIFITTSQRENTEFYQKLLKLPLFDKINEEVVKDYSKFNLNIEKKFTQAVVSQYDATVQNLAALLKNPEFLNLFKDKSNSLKWLADLQGLHNKDLIQQIVLDLSQGSTSFKLERTGEFTGFLLGEATFAYARYENSTELKKQFKSRQNYLMHVMEESTLLVQFNYKNATNRHACIFEGCSVVTSQEYHQNNPKRVKEKSVIDALSISATRKTIIPFVSVSSRTLTDSLVTQSEQAARFLTHITEIKKTIVAKALRVDVAEVSEEELSQWKIEPQMMDIAPIDESGKSKKGKSNSQILLGKASEENLGPITSDFNKINYRRELNHFTYLATLFSGVINDNFSKRRECAKSIDLAQCNYWSIGVDTQEIYQIGKYIKNIPQKSDVKKYKALHLYCAQKLSLLLQGLEQAQNFEAVLPVGSLNKINEILTVYHGICGSHGASCSNPIHKKDFPEYKNDETVAGLYKMGQRLIKWIDNYPGGTSSNLELFKEFKALKNLVGSSLEDFRANMMEFERPDAPKKSSAKKIKSR